MANKNSPAPVLLGAGELLLSYQSDFMPPERLGASLSL